VTNPYSETPPPVADLIDSTGFSGDEYAIFFENTIFSQFANELVICGVIINNLAAQSLGLHRIPESSENQAVRAVSHIPCFCHAINSVFVNSIRDCPTLRQIMDSVNLWEAVLRTRFTQRIMAGTKRCPSIPTTRWLYATDFLRWIGSHIPQIRNSKFDDGLSGG
jgi:hypothetical protein